MVTLIKNIDQNHHLIALIPTEYPFIKKVNGFSCHIIYYKLYEIDKLPLYD